MFHDQFIKRVLAISLGLSMVLCSIGFMLFSFGHVQSAQAAPTPKPAPWDEQIRGGVALGIVKDTGYFVVFGKPNNMLYKVELSKAKDWYAE